MGSIDMHMRMEVMQVRNSKGGQESASLVSLPPGKWSWELGVGYFGVLVNDFRRNDTAQRAHNGLGQSSSPGGGRLELGEGQNCTLNKVNF